MEPLGGEHQRGQSQAVSLRLDPITYQRIQQIVEDSTYSISGVFRAFAAAGIGQLDTNNPGEMDDPIELLWRDMKSLRDRRTRGRIAADMPTAEDLDVLRRQLDELQAALTKAKPER